MYIHWYKCKQTLSLHVLFVLSEQVKKPIGLEILAKLLTSYQWQVSIYTLIL